MDNNEKNTSFAMPIKKLNQDDYGYDNLKYLKELGATFEESHYEKYNKHFVVVNLPEGFYIGESFLSGRFKNRVIYDAEGNNRGLFLVRCDKMDVANLVMNKKFKIMSICTKTGEFKFERICFGNEDNILFEEGIVATNVRDHSELYVLSKLAKLREDCEEHADLLYPDWRNPLAYWDEEPEKTKPQTLARIKED